MRDADTLQILQRNSTPAKTQLIGDTQNRDRPTSLLNRSPKRLQDPNERLLISRRNSSQQLVVKLRDGFVDPTDDSPPGGREMHKEYAAVMFPLSLIKQAIGYQLIDDTSDRWSHLNHPLSNFQAGQRLAFSAKDSQHIVLSVGQLMLPQQAVQSILNKITRPQDA